MLALCSQCRLHHVIQWPREARAAAGTRDFIMVRVRGKEAHLHTHGNKQTRLGHLSQQL